MIVVLIIAGLGAIYAFGAAVWAGTAAIVRRIKDREKAILYAIGLPILTAIYGLSTFEICQKLDVDEVYMELFWVIEILAYLVGSICLITWTHRAPKDDPTRGFPIEI